MHHREQGVNATQSVSEPGIQTSLVSTVQNQEDECIDYSKNYKYSLLRINIPELDFCVMKQILPAI